MSNVYGSLLAPRNGTPEWPFLVNMETLREIKAWLAPLEEKLETLPIEEQQAFIDEQRREAKKRWPWWFPNCHVYVE